MLVEIKKLIKHSGIYSFGNISGHFLSFLLLPVYTRFLTTHQYGTLALITVFRAIFQRVVNLGTESSVVKVYFEVDNKRDKKGVISTAFAFLLIVASISTCCFWFFREKLSIVLLNSQEFTYLFSFALLASLFFIIKTVPLSVFRAQEKAGVYTIFAFLTLILGLSFNILFVVVFRENVKGILKSAFLSQFIIFLFIILPFSKNLVFKFKKEYLTRMLTFGLPIVPSGLALWVLTLLDRYFLKVYTTMDIVGVYSIGYKIATIMSMLVIAPFSMAWSPLMLKWHKEKNEREIYARVFKYFSIAGFFFALIISLYSKEVIRIMTTPAYYDAYRIVFFIVISYLFHGFYMIFAAGCTFVRKTFYFPIATGVAAIINTFLNILLIPHYQMMGAAFATVISYFVMILLIYIFSEKYYHIPFNLIDTIKIGCVTTTLYISGFFLSGNIAVTIAYKLLLLICYFPLLYMLRIFNQKEILVLKRIVRERIKR